MKAISLGKKITAFCSDLRAYEKITLALLLAAGIAARFWDIAWHFSHVDDLGVAKHIQDYKLLGDIPAAFTAIPNRWTYAPFQFWFTALLLNEQQSYRDLLFWGRLPSAFFSSLGLFLMVFFYKMYDGLKSGRVFIALVLMAVSWESIIHAKQMHNYALGTAAFTGLLILFMKTRDRAGDPAVMAWAGLLMGAFGWMHYQMLLFIPAFFGALVLLNFRKVPGPALAKGLGAGAGAFTALFLPLYFLYLKGKEGAGVYWNQGSYGEYLFDLSNASSLAGKISYAVSFFLKNWFIVLDSNTGFLTPETALQTAFYYLAGIFFAFGFLSLFLARGEREKDAAVFFASCFVVWNLLVISQKLTLSPTRHSLILLPAMAVVSAEGFSFLLSKVRTAAKITEEAGKKITAGFAGLVLIFFAAGYPAFLETRRDRFEEPKIIGILGAFGAEALIRAETLQPTVMKYIQAYFEDIEWFWPTYGILMRGGSPRNTIGWISSRHRLTEEVFEKSRESVNHSISIRNDAVNLPAWQHVEPLTEKLSDYEIIFAQEIPSGVEVDYNPRMNLTANAMYFYILRKKA